MVTFYTKGPKYVQEKNNIEESQKSSNIINFLKKKHKIINNKIILENLYYFHNQLIQTIILKKNLIAILVID